MSARSQSAGIGIANPGDVHVEHAAGGVAIDNADVVGLARAVVFINGRGAAIAINGDAIQRDVGGVLDGDHAIQFTSSR